MMMKYEHAFISQYVEIPPSISEKVQSLYSTETKGAVLYCIKLIVSNLLGHETVSYSRKFEFYAKQRMKDYSRTYMLRAVDLLARDGYVKETRGFKSVGYEKGIASCMSRTDKLTRDFEQPPSTDIATGKGKGGVRTLPLLMIFNKPIFKEADINRKLNRPHIIKLSHRVDYVSEIDLFKESRALNRLYFNRTRLDFSNLPGKDRYLREVGLTRIIQMGQVGRWVQLGGLSYQGLPGKDRLKVLINGMETCELDYSSMHPYLLYTWAKAQAPVDLYESVVDEIPTNGVDDPEALRKVVKKTILIAINAGSYLELVRAINDDKKEEVQANETRKKAGREEKAILYDEVKRFGLTPETIVEAFKKAHPKLASYVYSRSARALMWDESVIMTSVLWRLMGSCIPAVPIHDSLLFPKKHKDAVQQAMLAEYKRHTGFDIQVKQ